VVDVANRLLCLADQPAASDSYAALVRLQDLGFIEEASRYRDIVRFRNLVVHRYEDVMASLEDQRRMRAVPA